MQAFDCRFVAPLPRASCYDAWPTYFSASYAPKLAVKQLPLVFSTSSEWTSSSCLAVLGRTDPARSHEAAVFVLRHEPARQQDGGSGTAVVDGRDDPGPD